MSTWTSGAIVCAALLIGYSANALADDWPYYRHDTQRTGEQEPHFRTLQRSRVCRFDGNGRP